MRSWTRREFGGMAGAAVLAALRPRTARGQAKAKVVVIGGGVGGATAARYLAASSPAVEVVLVEPNKLYATCFFSNLYLAGLRSLQTLTHGYETLAGRYRISVVHDSAAAIDPDSKTVSLESGAKLSYDRLVVAPGIAFREGAIAGYGEAAMQVMPHAWRPGHRRRCCASSRPWRTAASSCWSLLRIRSAARPPLTSARLVASYFRRRKPRAKILILDAKDTFAGQNLFEDAWRRHYPGMIDWLPAQFTGGIEAVEVRTRTVKTAREPSRRTSPTLFRHRWPGSSPSRRVSPTGRDGVRSIQIHLSQR